MAIDITKYGVAVPNKTTNGIDVSRYGIPVTSTPVVEQPKPETFGATFPAKPNESLLSGATKLVGNIPSSAYGFAKGVVSFLNPINTFNTIKQIPTEFQALVQETGGVKNALGATTKEVLPSAYGLLVPKATQQIISGDFEGARNTLTNDPVGQILPYLLTAKSAAEKAGFGTQFDNAVTKIASPVTKPTEAVTSGVKNSITGTTRFGVSQATGLSPDTITKVITNPEAFSKEAQSTLDRGIIANEVKSILDEKQANLTETGGGYQEIRQANVPISVKPNLLTNVIKETTGLDIKNGNLTTSPSASIREAKDVRAIQNLYDLYQPKFARGAITAEEFLNLRTDLANMAKFERELTKSKPLENLSGIMRGKLNSEIRPNVPGLEGTDNLFASQISEFNRLKEGILDKKGNLTDTGINRIANATGKGKDNLVAKLEEISPGITEKIKVLKAIEDIKNAGGQKVGTYARAGGIVAGIATFNPYLILGSILAVPEIAVPLLRGVGMTTPMIESTLNLLKGSVSQLNRSPEYIQSLLTRDLQEIKPKLGLSIEDVSKSSAGIPNVKTNTTEAKNNPVGNNLNTEVPSKSSESKPNQQSNKGVSNVQSNSNPTTKSTISNLEAEARKYKTAEEFVKAQTNFNHASAGEIKQFVNDYPNQQPVFLTKDANYYKEHISPDAKNTPVKVNLGKTITLDASTIKKILNTGDDLRVEQFNLAQTRTRTQVFDWLKANGYDSATIPKDWHRGNEFRESTVVFNPAKQIQTKSQLIDIFNKANKAKSTIARDTSLTGKDAQLQEASIAKYENNKDKLLQDYLKKNGKVANADEAKKMFIDVGYKGVNSPSFQEASSALNKDAWRYNLNNNPEPYAVLYSGQSGAGKTSAIKGIKEVENVIKDASAILDGNLSSFKSAVDRIDEALAAGKIPSIVHIYRDPMEAFDGTITRMLTNKEEMGRIVPTKVSAANAVGARDTLSKIIDIANEKGIPKDLIYVVDNATGGKAKISTLADIEKKPFPSNLRELFNKRAKVWYTTGVKVKGKLLKITKDQYERLTK